MAESMSDKRLDNLRREMAKAKTPLDKRIVAKKQDMVKAELAMYSLLQKRGLIDEQIKYWNEAYQQFEEQKDELLMEKYGQVQNQVNPQRNNDNKVSETMGT